MRKPTQREQMAYSTIARLEAELAQAKAGGWQQISSAPRDGTEIILRKGDRVTAGAWIEWSETQSHYHGTTGEYLGQDEIGSGANWQSWDGGFCEDDEPTHWMPLPVPPTE